MEQKLQPRSEAGHRFVELAEKHAAEASERAAAGDREGAFPHETFAAMKESGFLAGTVPEEFGGMGATYAQDLAAAVNRLGRGDGSTAIATNMHLVFGPIASRILREAREAGDGLTAERMAAYLALLAGGAIGMANATEAGTDLRHPLTEARPVGGGWSLSGKKIFGTLSEMADLFFVPFRTSRPDGSFGGGFAIVPRGTPGQEIKSNWDALGMRASGSHDVVYEDCVVPADFVTAGEDDWGRDTPQSLVIATVGNIGLIAAFVGIAETARDVVVEMARTRTKAPDGRPIAERPGIQHQVAEMEADLATARALVQWAVEAIDDVVVERPPSEVSLDDLHGLNKEFQCAKLVVNRKAIEVVDRALTISGGAGYMTFSPLSRLYRDVRAGPFMQPLSPNEAYEYIGKVALGLDPD